MAQPNTPSVPIYKARSEQVHPTETVMLKVTFSDSSGTPMDLDSVPQVSIISPSGTILVNYTSAGVQKIGIGQYQFNYYISYGARWGIYHDVWQGLLSGFSIQSEFEFIVTNTQYESLQVDGYTLLGEDPGFNYSQIEIKNINKLLKALRARLNSEGLSKSTDEYGNTTFVDCGTFTTDMLVTFLGMAISEFNYIPHITFYSFKDTEIIDQFFELFVRGATIFALASKALIERGREFSFSDQGISFTPPTVSELLNTQFSTELSDYRQVLDLVKRNLKPAPQGLGTLSISTGNNQLISKFRFLRERRII